MPTRVWLMRHAQTCQPDVFHGFESDVDLSELGHRQADTIAPIIAGYRPDVIFSSSMLRARKTAEPIAKACGLALHVEPELHERKVGKLSGTPTHPAQGVWPDTLKRWIDGDTAYAPDGAESFDDLRKRLVPVWNRITTEHRDQSIVIVCHGIVCRVLLLSILPHYTIADWPKLGPVKNGSISELVEVEGIWRAIRIAETPSEIGELGRMG